MQERKEGWKEGREINKRASAVLGVRSEGRGRAGGNEVEAVLAMLEG